jgi:hypothetical protein
MPGPDMANGPSRSCGPPGGREKRRRSRTLEALRRSPTSPGSCLLRRHCAALELITDPLLEGIGELITDPLLNRVEMQRLGLASASIHSQQTFSKGTATGQRNQETKFAAYDYENKFHWSANSRQATATPVHQTSASSDSPKSRRAFPVRVRRGALRMGWIAVFLLLFSLQVFAQPSIPMEWFYFPQDFSTLYGSVPIALYDKPHLRAGGHILGCGPNALILDTTNLDPACLEYAVVDTNWVQNFTYDTGTVLFYFAPNWASVSQGGTGPGETAYFVAGGDWSSNSPDGLLAIYTDAYGSNIYFGAVSNGYPPTTPAPLFHGHPIRFIKSAWSGEAPEAGSPPGARFIWMGRWQPRGAESASCRSWGPTPTGSAPMEICWLR